jgi:hypothetical protein
MSKLARAILGLLPMLAGVAFGAPAGAEPLPATTRVHGRFTIAGKLARYLVSPNGDIDGLVMVDGTVARFPPQAWGRREPQEANGLREASLRPMTVTREIEGFSIDPRGRIDRILFVDGTNARAGKRVRLEALALKAGDTITVTGKGGNYPQGSSLDIATMKLPSGEVRTFDPLHADLIPVSHEGEVVCILLDPRGDLDGFLLEDGTVVRLRPTVPNPLLSVGSNVRAEGEGTSSFIRADKVTLTSSGAVLDLSTAPRAVRAPRSLTMLDGSSTILRVVNDREGKVDTLVLGDGSIVKLPPTLRDQAGDTLVVGTRLTARGKGGTYGLVKAFRADRVQLASGQVFAEPERPLPSPTKR